MTFKSRITTSFFSKMKLQYSLHFLILVIGILEGRTQLVASSSPPKDSKDCAHGWTKYHNKCFIPVTEHVTFSQAIDTCSRLQSTLAMIESMDEQMFIEEHLMENQEKEINSMWIGCMRFHSSEYTTESFRWLNGSPVNFSLWHPTEPNNLGGMQFCVALWGGKEHTGSWMDAKCDKKYLALCQRPLNGLPTLSVDKPKAKTFDFAIKKAYRNIDFAYMQLYRTTVRLWILSVVCVVLLSILTSMCFLGDFSNSPIRCLFPRRSPWTSNSSDTTGLVNQINNLNNIIDQEAGIGNNYTANSVATAQVEDTKKTGDANGNLQ